MRESCHAVNDNPLRRDLLEVVARPSAGAVASHLVEGFAELMWPTRCVVCDEPGDLLCCSCRKQLAWIEQRFACPICGSPFGWLTCVDCGAEAMRQRREQERLGRREEALPSSWEMRTVISALEFSGSGALLATTLKDAHELRLAPLIAAIMATSLDEASSWPAADGTARFDASQLDGLCFVPASPAAYRRRGFDHMEQVAGALAKELDLPLFDVLVRADRSDQRTLDRQGRLSNLQGSLDVIDDVGAARLLLIDDVITTGATLRESTRALLARGAQSVTACSLARAW